MVYQVYVVVNKLNGKMYVGCTERDLKVRLQRHQAKTNEGSRCSIHKAIRKYGIQNFDIRMVEEYDTEEAMFCEEVGWIAYFDTYKSPYGYNDTRGGEGGNTNGGKKFSEDWKLKISKSHAGKGKKLNRKFAEEIEYEICKLYVSEQASMYSLGKQFGCRRTTISDILQRAGIETRKSNYTGHSNGRNLFSLEQEVSICSQYSSNGTSMTELAKRFDCGITTIRGLLIRHNVKL